MAGNDAKQTGLTFTAELDALRIPKGLGIWSEAGGQVSGLELTVFRDAVADRVRERTTDSGDEKDLADPFSPAAALPEELKEKLIRAHGLGVTAADILLHEAAMRPEVAERPST